MIEVSVLGPIEVRRDGAVVPIPGAKPRALLAALVIHANEPVSQSRLIDALWGASPPPRAGANLHVHMATLRKLIADDQDVSVETTAAGYTLRIDSERIDARRFERLVRDAPDRPEAADQLRAALALWRGPALAEVADEPFARVEALRLEEARLSALEQRVDADLAKGRHRELVPELESRVAANPLRERAAGQLMRALYAAGRQADALTVYRNLRRRLVDELGIEPSPELQLLERAVLRHDASLGPSPRSAAAPIPRRRRRAVVTAAVLALAGGGIAAGIVTTKGGGARARPALTPVANSVVEIDPATGRIRSVVRVGDTPVSIATTPGALWVANRGDRTVSRIDLRTHGVRTIGGVPFAYDVVPDHRGDIWVSTLPRRSVTRITAGTQGFPASPSPPETIRMPHAAGAIAAGGGYLWVTDSGWMNGAEGETVTPIDLASHRVGAPIRVGEQPRTIAFGYGSVWVGLYRSQGASGLLGVIAPGSSTVETRVVDPGGEVAPRAIAVGAGSVWVLTFSDHVVRVDPDTRRISQVIDLRNAGGSLSIALGAGAVWVTERSAFAIAEIDPHTNRIVRTIPLGNLDAVPCGIAATAGAVWVTIAPDTNCGSPETQ